MNSVQCYHILYEFCTLWAVKEYGVSSAAFRFTAALPWDRHYVDSPGRSWICFPLLISLFNARILVILHHIQPGLCMFLLIRSLLGLVHLKVIICWRIGIIQWYTRMTICSFCVLALTAIRWVSISKCTILIFKYILRDMFALFYVLKILNFFL